MFVINIFMINKFDTKYTGPVPKDINQKFPDHSYEFVTCLINGEQKKIIQNRYLEKFGYTKQTYLEKFPNAPLKSFSASESYRKSALSEKGKQARSRNMKLLNTKNVEFQIKRQQGVEQFWISDKSHDRRKKLSEMCKEQHKHGLEDSIRKYFFTKYKGSIDQVERRKRMKENNPSHDPKNIEKAKQTWLRNYNENKHFKKSYYKNTNLTFQSRLEYQFLVQCEHLNILQRIKNAPSLKDEIYPRRFYIPDFMLDNLYIIEIKSWYIEEKQFKINPLVNEEKKQLVCRLGYKWLYIKDNDLSEFMSII